MVLIQKDSQFNTWFPGDKSINHQTFPVGVGSTLQLRWDSAVRDEGSEDSQLIAQEH